MTRVELNLDIKDELTNDEYDKLMCCIEEKIRDFSEVTNVEIGVGIQDDEY